MTTLEYHEMILDKVSFDEELLKKELEKAIPNVTCSDKKALLEWCRENLGEEYEAIASEMMRNKICSWDEENYKT